MERGASEHLETPLMMSTEWEDRYQKGETPWEKGAAHPALIEFLRSTPVTGRGLVPGCGLGHDVRALAATADEVIGIDIAPSAIKAASSFPQVGGETFVHGDLFALPKSWHGAFDWVFEHTCFCAIDRSLRAAYVEAVAQLLYPGGYLFAVFFLEPQMDPGEQGPPFGVTLQELDALFSPRFALEKEWTPERTFAAREGRERCRVLRRMV
jgi:methyl halide transferase